ALLAFAPSAAAKAIEGSLTVGAPVELWGEAETAARGGIAIHTSSTIGDATIAAEVLTVVVRTYNYTEGRAPNETEERSDHASALATALPGARIGFEAGAAQRIRTSAAGGAVPTTDEVASGTPIAASLAVSPERTAEAARPPEGPERAPLRATPFLFASCPEPNACFTLEPRRTVTIEGRLRTGLDPGGAIRVDSSAGSVEYRSIVEEQEWTEGGVDAPVVGPVGGTRQRAVVVTFVFLEATEARVALVARAGDAPDEGPSTVLVAYLPRVSMAAGVARLPASTGTLAVGSDRQTLDGDDVVLGGDVVLAFSTTEPLTLSVAGDAAEVRILDAGLSTPGPESGASLAAFLAAAVAFRLKYPRRVR
ncbi:MAG: hypothetical protein ACT4PT_14200, partial [Methanobacteriota archaeon]